jgi:hypothetical protein
MTTARILSVVKVEADDQQAIDLSDDLCELKRVTNDFFATQAKFYIDLMHMIDVLTYSSVTSRLSARHQKKLAIYLAPYQFLLAIGNPFTEETTDVIRNVYHITSVFLSKHDIFSEMTKQFCGCINVIDDFKHLLDKIESKNTSVFKIMSNMICNVTDLKAPYNPNALASMIIKPLQFMTRYIIFLERMRNSLPSSTSSLLITQLRTELAASEDYLTLVSDSLNDGTFSPLLAKHKNKIKEVSLVSSPSFKIKK